MNFKPFHWKSLLVSLAVSLGTGGLSAFFTRNSMADYIRLNKPPLSPPPIVFPIVWTILFLLMGISAWMVYRVQAEARRRKRGWFVSPLRLYAVQLAVNFFWPILFFALKLRLFAFFWLLLLIVLVVLMIVQFYQSGSSFSKPDPELSPLYQHRPPSDAVQRGAPFYGKAAALLQIPYLLWLCFAGYLNLGVWLLNR